MTRITAEDFERAEERKSWNAKRQNGSIPRLTDAMLDDPEWLRDWLTAALRPREGWRVRDFEHGEDLDMPCSLALANGQEQVTYRWRSQRDLIGSPAKFRASVSTVASGQLRPPHLKPQELGDLWQALCALRPAIVAESEPDQAKDWLFKALDTARLLEGHTLTDPAGQRDALAAMRRLGEFTYLDAVTVTRRPEDQWPRRPICLLDRVTGVLALRPRETLTVLRHIFDIKPLRGTVLTYRWGEIGVEHRRFDVGRHAGDLHLKANLYLVPKAAKTGTEN